MLFGMGLIPVELVWVDVVVKWFRFNSYSSFVTSNLFSHSLLQIGVLGPVLLLRKVDTPYSVTFIIKYPYLSDMWYGTDVDP